MKIVLCDFVGSPDGHSLKVLRETADLMKSAGIETTICAPNNYKISFKKYPFVQLPFEIKNNEQKKSKFLIFLGKLIRFFKYTSNLAKIFSIKNVVWISTVNPSFFVILYFFIRIKCKLIVTLYIQDYNFLNKNSFMIKLINHCFYKSLAKISFIVSTNENLKFNNKMIFLKDYYFISSLYGKYSNRFLNKKEQIVCIGTIDKEKKDLKNAVLALQKIDIPFIIAGHFREDEYYVEINNLNKNKKIKIINKKLSEEEYYNILAESRFVLLPYFKNAYKNKTSGVLQESMFLKTIPITHDNLLSFNNIAGLGYQNIFEISIMNFKEVDFDKYYSIYDELINTAYSKDCFIKNIIHMLHYVEA